MLFNLTYKVLKNNKKRTFVTILGIIFSSALLFGVGLLTSTLRDSAIKQVKDNYGDYHISVDKINQSEKKIIDKQTNIGDIIYISFINSECKKSNNEMYDTININLYGSDSKYNSYIKLSSGRYAKNSEEIIVPQNLFEESKLKINDLYKINSKEYKIVGVYSKTSVIQYKYYEGIYEQSYDVYTTYKNNNNLRAYITFASTNGIINKIEQFTTNIGRKITHDMGNTEYQDIKPNYPLIDYYYYDSSNQTMAIMFLSILVIGSVLGLFCIFVIYNSFAISVNERKKMFGILSSVGAYKGQILRSVFIEAMIVSIIAIPLGFLLSLGLTSGIIEIINNMMGEFMSVKYQLAIYPLFMIVSLFIIIMAIIISAYRPAKNASLTTPIEAIRMNKEYHLNNKKIKSSKLIKKLFNVEGEIAYLNLKRNKKRYHTTMLSIIISIVLFLVFSTYINFGIVESNKNINMGREDYNIDLYVESNPKADEFYHKLKRLDEIKEISSLKSLFVFNGFDNSKSYTPEYLSYINSQGILGQNYLDKYLPIFSIDKEEYEDYIRKNNISKDKPILINYSKFRIYDERSGYIEEIKKMKVYQDNSKLKFNICDLDSNFQTYNCRYEFDEMYVNNKIINDYLSAPGVLVSEEMYNNVFNNYVDKQKYTSADSLKIYIKSDSYKKLDDEIKDLISQYPDLEISYGNYNMQRYQQDMTFFTIKLVLYTFLGFIGIIAITSMFNTINTSMELRRNEFAVLRSVGISPTGFRKMILLESLFFGIKSLIYGLLVSFVIIFGISKIFDLSSGVNKMTIPFPTMYIIFVVIAVILIIVLTMFYSIRKIRKDNIIETIRNEAV